MGAIVRVKEVAAPLRKTPKRDQARLGTYPVPPVAAIWWMNRMQVPGGQIQQSMSPYQMKIMWQYFWNFPLVLALVEVGVASVHSKLPCLHLHIQVLPVGRGGRYPCESLVLDIHAKAWY